jgi:tRNA(Ile)-lysidine synthase
VKNPSSWTPLDHLVWSDLQKYPGLKGSCWALCCSGGRDSVTLFHVIKRLSVSLDLSLVLLHFHHGGDSSYRQESLNLVTELSRDHQVPMVCVRSLVELTKEEEMRAFRRHSALCWLENQKDKSKPTFLVTAHHGQDLLETRLLRLIRGTGIQGLRAMSLWDPPWLKPFLFQNSALIREEVEIRSYSYQEDPSNHDPRYLRNWIRHVWLPSLEIRYPGATQRFAQSFEHLIYPESGVHRGNEANRVNKENEAHEAKAAKEEGRGEGETKETKQKVWDLYPGVVVACDLSPQSEEGVFKEAQKCWGLFEPLFLLLSQQDQFRCVAHIFYELGSQNYTRNHIQEVLKHWAQPQKDCEFFIGGLRWSKKETWLYARKVEKR